MTLFRLPQRLVRAGTLLGALALAVTAGVSPAAATSAQDAYRYWGYYQLTEDEWAFAQTGPDGTTPADGAVEGWRFAVAGPSDVRTPRALPAFEEVCGAEEAAAGEKRVAVVIDYGREADAPDGAQPPEPRADCAVVDEAASGADVLATVAETRVEDGLVCGLDGYPATGCGDPVPEVSPEAAAADEPVELTGLVGQTPTDDATESQASDDDAAAAADDDAAAAEDDEGPGAGLWLGIAAAAAVVALAVAASRRRRDLADG
ncbi:SCO2322 family protein [Quadrisphaera sp. GCM10027208]|uniref:SCO2322 family protein n=1 Tax=Quadrisphaera sp. GCM10027208 TaxID=3273423 RepID=UPI003616ADB3